MEKAHQERNSAEVKMDEKPVLAWRVHLLRDEPKRMLLIAPVVLAGLTLGFLFTHNLILLVVALLLFTSAIAEYLFPIKYTITEQGAAVRSLIGRSSVEWERVKKYYLDDSGIKLSTLHKPSRLEAYRGVYLRFGGNRDEVIEVVRRIRDARRAES